MADHIEMRCEVKEGDGLVIKVKDLSVRKNGMIFYYVKDGKCMIPKI